MQTCSVGGEIVVSDAVLDQFWFSTGISKRLFSLFSV